MKKILILLLLITIILIISILMANQYIEREINGNVLKDTNCTDCKVEIGDKNSDNNISKFTIAPISIKKIKKNSKEPEIINKIETTNKREKLDTKIEKLTQELTTYKALKSKEIKELNTKLNVVNRALLKSQKELKIVKQIKKSKKITVKKSLPIVKIEPQIEAYLSPIPIDIKENPHISWREVVINEESDIFDLAIKYYGNRNEYQKIYQANPNTIGTDFKIKIGMLLKIPIEESYSEEPIILNID